MQKCSGPLQPRTSPDHDQGDETCGRNSPAERTYVLEEQVRSEKHPSIPCRCLRSSFVQDGCESGETAYAPQEEACNPFLRQTHQAHGIIISRGNSREGQGKNQGIIEEKCFGTWGGSVDGNGIGLRRIAFCLQFARVFRLSQLFVSSRLISFLHYFYVHMHCIA